jgi:hypothetical protein
MVEMEPDGHNHYGINESGKYTGAEEIVEDIATYGVRKRNVGREGEKGADHESIQLELDSSGDEHQALIKNKKDKEDRLPICYGVRRFLGWVTSRERRHI